MKKWIVSVSGISLSAVFGLLSPAYALEAGQLAPELTLSGIPGIARLSDYQGKVVYLDFWASWCGPCKKSFPWMNTLQEKYAAQGFQVVAINLDAIAADSQRFLQQVPANFALAFDHKAESARRFEVKGMPSSILIGRDGKILAVHAGFNDETGEKIEKMIRSAIAF